MVHVVHHLMHGCCVLLWVGATATCVPMAAFLRHHHWIVWVLVIEQVVEKRWVRVRSHRHSSASLIPWVDVGHVRAKLSQRCRPLCLGLFFLWAIITEHVREFSTFIWNSTFKTVTRPYLELFIIAEQCLIWLWHFDQRIIGNWLEPRNIERSWAFLHRWSLHEAFFVGSHQLL